MSSEHFPVLIDPELTFKEVVDWIHSEIIEQHKAPGVIVGLSGTDSLVVFLAAYEAFKRVGRPSRVWGVHFAPSEDFLCDHPEAEVHTWFSKQIIPWLVEKCPQAQIEVNTDIDWRMDGVRWGMLNEMGAVSYEGNRHMRPSEERFWVLGTRNKSEDLLFTYSNASMAAGFQPLANLWKSEILQISQALGLPQVAIDKSCDVDCICGRQRLPAHHIQEIDYLLMVNEHELSSESPVIKNMDAGLRNQLIAYIRDQIGRSNYKAQIPFRPHAWNVASVDATVAEFETGVLDLRTFDHRKHLYVGWCYLRAMPLKEATERYCYYLKAILDKAGVVGKYNEEITKSYMLKISEAMLAGYKGFDEMVDNINGLNNYSFSCSTRG